MPARLGTGMGEVEFVAVPVVVALVEGEVEVEVELAVGAAATGRRGAGRCCDVAEDAAGGFGPNCTLGGAEVNRAGGVTFARATPANASATTATPSATRVCPWRKRGRHPSDLVCVRSEEHTSELQS